MLKYKVDILEELKKSGYSTYRIRKENLLTQGAMQYIRDGRIIGPVPLNDICRLLNCQPGDLLEYVPDDSASDTGNSSPAGNPQSANNPQSASNP